jgi:ApbE superfamily uncharacterized protein (UPF0280 family)
MYQPRDYRHWVQDRELVSFNVVSKETDLYIRASSDLSIKARKLVLEYRRQIEGYIAQHPSFASSLKPLPVTEEAPPIVREMTDATRKFSVGPMASVAGAIAQFVGCGLLDHSPEVIVENGGDIFINSSRDRVIAIYAGKSPLSGRLGLEIKGEETPLGVCTSSGTVGHSLSLGRADAVVVVAESATLADAAATAIGNIISQAEDISAGIEMAQRNRELLGVLIIKNDKIGIWGRIKICQLPNSEHNLDIATSPNL